jgi:hypothetical protein
MKEKSRRRIDVDLMNEIEESVYHVVTLGVLTLSPGCVACGLDGISAAGQDTSEASSVRVTSTDDSVEQLLRLS